MDQKAVYICGNDLKMGDSDTAMLWTILIIFIGLGAVLPFINAAFNQNVTTQESELVKNSASGNLEAATQSVSILSVILSIFTIFFWTFGQIPAVLDLVIFIPMRIIFLVLLYRNLRGN